MKRVLWGALFAIICLNPADLSAAPINPRAVQLFNKGDYRAIAAIAKAENNADNYAYAARALMTEAAVNRPSQTSDDTLNQAQALVNKALKLNKNHKEALLVDASITLIRARKAGGLRGLAAGFPQSGKMKLDNIISLYPNYAEAWALRAAWNLEAVVVTGNSAALLGASAETGINEYKKAIMLEGNNLMIKYAFATSLILLDRNAYKNAYSRLLEVCIATKSNVKSDQILIARCKELKSAIDAGSPDLAYKKVKSWI